MSFGGLLNATATWQQRSGTRTTDSHGEIQQAFVSAGDIRVSIQEQRERHGLAFAGETDLAERVVFCREDVEVGDRLIVSGQTFRVIASIDAAGRGHHRELLAQEVVEDA